MKAPLMVPLLSALLLLSGCFPNYSDIPRHEVDLPAVPLEFGAASEPEGSPVYRLQTGDRLAIKSQFHEELGGKATVGPDGQAAIPGLGQFQAVGLTVDEFAAEITRRAAITHRDPSITVTVEEYTKYRAFIGGEVRRPGYVDLQPGMTSLRAVMERGGFSYTARLDSVLHIAWNPQGGYSAKRVDLRRVLETGDTTQDLALGPNDVVYVPATWITNADLWVRQWLIDLIPVREPTTRLSDF
jgi:protein involved in polysaccharide export with SLBB domain